MSIPQRRPSSSRMALQCLGIWFLEPMVSAYQALWLWKERFQIHDSPFEISQRRNNKAFRRAHRYNDDVGG
ncbi:hypothetical protein LB505_011783 [Fusarium chuoi]|nr:hypothetical protein LB505_011783 [Fusarium chuoi]